MDMSKYFEEAKQIMEEAIAKMSYEEIKKIKEKYGNGDEVKQPKNAWLIYVKYSKIFTVYWWAHLSIFTHVKHILSIFEKCCMSSVSACKSWDFFYSKNWFFKCTIYPVHGEFKHCNPFNPFFTYFVSYGIINMPNQVIARITGFLLPLLSFFIWNYWQKNK